MDKVKIPIDAKVLFQMYEYANYAHKIHHSEIAGWAHYNKKKGIYKLSPLLRQEASGAEVISFPNSILNDTQYDISDMIVQWHSHVMFSCSPSQPDKELISDALELLPMIISIIVNCKGEYSATVALKRTDIFTFQDYIKLDVELESYYDNPMIAKEVKKKLFKPKPQPVIVPSTCFHKGQFGKWIGGVFVPENKSLPEHTGDFRNSPAYDKDFYKVTPVMQHNNVSNVDSREDDLFSDFDYTPPTYKKLMGYDDILKLVENIENAHTDFINVYRYDDYIVVFSAWTENYIEVHPDGITCNGVPSEWNEAVKKLGVFNEKYQLVKDNENKVTKT